MYLSNFMILEVDKFGSYARMGNPINDLGSNSVLIDLMTRMMTAYDNWNR